ncbi:MAG: BspA family leucine-rich repeat surface protein [Flavobacteriaceae bacterium]
MKTIYIFFLSTALLSVSTILNAQNFYLHTNGVTCMCPDAAIGETGMVNGVTYTKRTKEQITVQNAETTCTSGITDMSYMFNYQVEFNGDISSWDVSNVTNMRYMFRRALDFNQPLNFWDVSNVTDMSNMLTGWPLDTEEVMQFNQPLNNWDVSNVTNMENMFGENASFNQPLNNWDVSNVSNMDWMFWIAENFNQTLHNWSVSNVTTMRAMFASASSFNQDLSDWQFNINVQFTDQFEGGLISETNVSIENYDALLQSLSDQNLVNKNFKADNLIFCNNSAREDLINNKGWTITGDTTIPTSITAPNNISVNTDPGTCVATSVDLGSPITESCLTYTVTNNAPSPFPLGTTQVIWTITDSQGNTAQATQIVTVNIQVDIASICYVSSDDVEITRNRIFINNQDWSNVEHYQVLRETSANVFDPIGLIPVGETSLLDLTSNNSAQTYRYRVRTLDICNNLSSSSTIHRTILLQSSVSTNNSVNLLWNAYEGVSFGNYNIYRKVNEEDFEIIATVPSNNFTYNDTQANVLENTYQYYVAIEIPACVTGLNTVEIKSNREILDPNMSVVDVLLNSKVIIYPNPSNSWITIQLNDDIQFFKGEVYNILGQKVLDVDQPKFLIKNLAASTYFIKIYTSEGQAVKQFIKI